MGNASTKESRQPGAAESAFHAQTANDVGRSRTRAGRGDLSFLSLGGGTPSPRDRNRQNVPFEHRETKQEREARRLERERAVRAKEREHSLREEHVDGGYLVTLGTYTGTEDFSKPVIRQLQIERKLAPFWRGLNDWSDHWAEHQLIAAARGLPVPAADAPPDPDLVPQPLAPESEPSQSLQNLTVPMGPRTLSAASDKSGSGTASGLASPSPSPGVRGSIKPRARALAMALTGSSRNASSTELTPVESSLPYDPFVNGQPLEVYIYKDAIDCPICFLSYPPYLNRTRCCDQPICSECFVQIKRADPHLPEHHPDGEARDPNQELSPDDPPEMLISEPSSCPYCQQPEFGVTYEPPPFRRGLVYYAAPAGNPSSSTPMSSQSSLQSTLAPAEPHQPGRRRGHSLSANAPNVITTDRIRPDWSTKLASARAHQARRAAAATALHTAAFVVGGSDQRSLLRGGRFGRRNTGSGGGTPANGSIVVDGPDDGPEPGQRTSSALNADGQRRTRMDDLEEMMFMEAVRLSLAAEEERKRKEAKAIRKEAKRREQADKKALRKQAKDPYGGSISGASGSSLSLGGLGRKRGNSVASNLRVEATVQGASHGKPDDRPGAAAPFAADDGAADSADKGKAVDRRPPDASASASASLAESGPSAAVPIRSGGSHLRQMSNASSIGSSLADTPSGSYTGPGFLSSEAPRPGRGEHGDRDDGIEPMFNFRSLAELVGVNIDDGSSTRDPDESPAEAGGGEKDGAARPLSQVKEEKEKEEWEAEHRGEDQQHKAAATSPETKAASGPATSDELPWQSESVTQVEPALTDATEASRASPKDGLASKGAESQETAPQSKPATVG